MNTLDTQSDIPAAETPEPAMPNLAVIEDFAVAEPAALPQQEQSPGYPQAHTSSRMPKAFGHPDDLSSLAQLGRSRSLDALNAGGPVAEIQDLCHQMVTGNPFPRHHDDEFRAYFGKGYTSAGVKK